MELIEREALLRDAIDVEVNGVTISAVPSGIIRYAPTIDPIKAAGGCYRRECRFRGDPKECPLLYFNQREIDDHNTIDTDFCSYGEPREEQDDE